MSIKIMTRTAMKKIQIYNPDFDKGTLVNVYFVVFFIDIIYCVSRIYN